jgi:hypothetical protein
LYTEEEAAEEEGEEAEENIRKEARAGGTAWPRPR